MSKPREFTATCLLDKSRSFTVYEPRTYNNDMNKVYAELRYNSGEKGKGNDVAILQKEARELTELMINHYGKGTEVGKQVNHYRTLFKALPEKRILLHIGQLLIQELHLFSIATMLTPRMITFTFMLNLSIK